LLIWVYAAGLPEPLSSVGIAAPAAGPQPPLEPISDTDIRVLCYLPTNLPISDIASELYVLPNTVKTHIRHLYGKLGTHRRSQPVTAPAPSACSHPLDGADPGLAGAGLR
jgi:DNA-binding NarL/FixJ family response regulator